MSLQIDAKSAVAVACSGALLFVAGAHLTRRQQRSVASHDDLPFQASEGKQVPDEQHAEFNFERLPTYLMLERATNYYHLMNMRRTVRFFSSDAPPLEVVKQCVLAAGTAPSGAHMQPWFFAIVKDAGLKQQIREAVVAEEQLNYDQRMRRQWVNDVKSMVEKVHDGASVQKAYLTEAPYIVVQFKQVSQVQENGSAIQPYYASESSGIAAGMLIAALHNANLTTLTSTPMGAEAKIRKILGRPESEKVYLLMPVGWPAKHATVPSRPNNGGRRDFDGIAKVY